MLPEYIQYYFKKGMVRLESQNRNKVVFSRKVLKGPKIDVASVGYCDNNNKTAFILQPLLMLEATFFVHFSGTLKSYAILIELFIASMSTLLLTNPKAH